MKIRLRRVVNGVRHDISPWIRGMFDRYVSRDLDRHGAKDLISPRGNSGDYDGVFWLEQVGTKVPVPSFTLPGQSKVQPYFYRLLIGWNFAPVRQPTLHPSRPRRDLDGTLSPKFRSYNSELRTQNSELRTQNSELRI